jgi:hypothetical protein
VENAPGETGSPIFECAGKSESETRVTGSPFLERAGSSECIYYGHGSDCNEQLKLTERL